MKEITFKVYEFNELAKPVQEKLRREAIDTLVDGNFEIFKDIAKDTLLLKYGIYAEEIHYSLSYCQGDGLHFNTENLLTNEIFYLISEKLSPNALILAQWLKETQYPTLCSWHRGMYEYATSRDVLWANNKDIEPSENLIDDFRENHPDILLTSKYFEEVRNAVKDVYLQICSELEKEGYKCYEISDEQLDSYFTDEFYFENGMLYRS